MQMMGGPQPERDDEKKSVDWTNGVKGATPGWMPD